MREATAKLLDRIYLSCIWISGASLVVMALIVPWGVFTRHVLDRAASWPEPVAIICMLVFTFLGAAASYRAGAHIAVTAVTDRVPETLRKVFGVLVNLLMLGAAGFVLIWGAQLCLLTWNQTMPDLPAVRVGLSYLPIPLGALCTIVFVIECIVLGAQSRRAVCTIDQNVEEA
ncbi:TRAP transporter small permease [uncultured Propionivibrio sp.]|uniref:TRAP transporter small permease n=1 Tax=uncultured Propionivibrio sp. TaxID=426737 RepID=UPI0029C06FEF|nr:TRAP transporter small permease [uncultured Propionivibrio sp.]